MSQRRPNPRKRLPPKGPLTLFALCGLLLFVSFQNFSSIPLENLKPELPQARALRKTPEGSTDIRDWAPDKPEGMDQPTLIAPSSGEDLDSISRDWFSKQGQMLTGGAEQRLLASVNKRLDRWMKFEPVKGEPWPEPGDGSGSSDDSGDSAGDGGSPSKPQLPEGTEDIFSFRPTSVRVLTVNRVEVNFAGRAQLTCLVNGNKLELDLNQPITDTFGFDVRHNSSEQANSVHLNYNW